jgi:hypothetical protein
MNECKLIIDETLKKNKIIITGDKAQEVEMINKYHILYDNYQSRVILSNFNKGVETNINNFFKLYLSNTKSIWNYIPWYNKKLSSSEIYANSLVKFTKFNNDKNGEDDYFIDLAIAHLLNNGLNVKREGIIEYRHFDLSNSEHDPIFFDVYKDDELLGFNVETCIFITQSNEKIFGNWDFYMISSPGPTIYKNSNSELTKNISKKEIPITNNSLILISGNIMYCPQALYGDGARNYIIVKLRSLR